eukprot:604268-Amphidinium_carterae.1
MLAAASLLEVRLHAACTDSESHLRATLVPMFPPISGEEEGQGVSKEALNAAFRVGDLCVRCGQAVEDLEHVHHCPAWQAELPVSALDDPPCVCVHGFAPALVQQLLPMQEPALAARFGVRTV